MRCSSGSPGSSCSNAPRVEDAHQQAGVGHRRLLATAAVARWAWVSAGTIGADLYLAGAVERDDAAAASADARDLTRERIDDEIVLELERGIDERTAAGDDADVARGTAD